MMQGIRIETTDRPGKDIVERLIAGLVEFNSSVRRRDHRELGVFVFDNESLIGGAYGGSAWDWVHLRYLWVDAPRRGKGIGRKILAAVETEARQRTCIGIHLDTFSFQALPFYLKAGYSIFGTIEDHPRGDSRYFLKKRLDG